MKYNFHLIQLFTRKIYAMDSLIPVQSPPSGIFHADDLQWTWEVRCSLVEIARIPSERVDDFVDGEGRRNIDFETNFWKRRTNDKPGPNTDWIKIVTYWCAFGPFNQPYRIPNTIPRKGTYPPLGKGDNSRPRSRKINFNDHLKRGCVCNFVVTYYKSEPDIAVIYYRQRYVYLV